MITRAYINIGTLLILLITLMDITRPPISKASVASSSIQGVIHRTMAIVSGEDGISTIILRR